MSNTVYEPRLFICPQFDYLHSKVHFNESILKKKEDIEYVSCEKDNGEVISYLITPEYYERSVYDRFWDYPVLFEKDEVSIWVDGTLFLRHLVVKAPAGPFDVNGLNRKAARLLEYKKYVESLDADYTDLSQERPQARITYRYYIHLYDLNCSPSVLNQKTGIVYEFYKWLSKQEGSVIDLSRVDQVETVWVNYKRNNSDKSNYGGKQGKYVQQRSQTVPVPKASDPKMGFIRDEGEDLRPLSDGELDLMMQSIGSDKFNTQERLVCLFSLNTGARKQTTLTLRRSTFKSYKEETLEPDKTFKVAVGGGNLVSSKKRKVHNIYVPEAMVESLNSYIVSEEYQIRLERYRELFPLMPDGDEYIFLSERGNPRYMSHRDPYYRQYGHKMIGKLASDIKTKLLSDPSIKDFPRDFKFHWTRATFAKKYYEFLLLQVNEKKITVTDALHRVAKRMGHSDITTTQIYIDIFNDYDYLLDAQNRYEEEAYKGIVINEY